MSFVNPRHNNTLNIMYHGSHTGYGYNQCVPHLCEKRAATHLKERLDKNHPPITIVHKREQYTKKIINTN